MPLTDVKCRTVKATDKPLKMADLPEQPHQPLHGFRAGARSLLPERGWSVPALERQLDHAERSKVVAAYARSEHPDKRRRMMAD